MNKADIRYLEDKFVKTARECKQYEILTKSTYDTHLKESQIAVMEEFIDHVKTLISVLGYRVFSEAVDLPSTPDGILFCTGANADAKGHFSSGGFKVLAGSKTSDHEVDSFETRAKGYYDLKRKLEEKGVIVDRIFTIDYEFSSPSAAAAVVLGRSANGKKEWNLIK